MTAVHVGSYSIQYKIMKLEPLGVYSQLGLNSYRAINSKEQVRGRAASHQWHQQAGWLMVGSTYSASSIHVSGKSMNGSGRSFPLTLPVELTERNITRSRRYGVS